MWSHVLAISTTWQSYYANHAAIRTMVAFAHVAALIAGGGMAVTNDMEAVRLRPTSADDRRMILSRLRASHTLVISALTVIGVSGILLVASDIDAFIASTYFWTKMGLVALLVANGLFLVAMERRAAQSPDDSQWRRVRLAATFSVTLWFVTTLAGVALPNVG